MAVIPAHGGNQGIPRKNLRILNGRPLVYYQIQNAINSRFITDVVVSSEDLEILRFVSQFSVERRVRPKGLSHDEATLDPVVYDALRYMEKLRKKTFSIVVTLQPTSPLLSMKSLESALSEFIDGDIDSLISVVDATHLYWKEKHRSFIPDYPIRSNRQFLPRRLKETGSFMISRRRFVKPQSRLGPKVRLYVIDPSEAVDIDTPLDWMIANSLMNRMKIVFVVAGNVEVGLGHVYNCLSLANAMLGHTLFFIALDGDPRSVDLIRSNGYAVRSYGLNETIRSLQELKPSIIINDILDTDRKYVEKTKESGAFVVNFEDLGDGAMSANLVFNAMYERSDHPWNHRFGFRYSCLSDRFLLYPPQSFRNEADTLLVAFGGLDENNLSSRVLSIIPQVAQRTKLRVVLLIVGLGYSKLDSLQSQAKSLLQSHVSVNIELRQNVTNMPELMSLSDVAVTSNGRTTHELAAMGLPTISIAQNDRETTHLFARYSEGVKYLGMAKNVTDDAITEAIVEILNNRDLRRQMHHAQLKDGEIMRRGLARVTNEILTGAAQWIGESQDRKENN